MTGNFGDVLWRALRLYPDKPAIEQATLSLTWTDVDRRASRLARVLTGYGVGRGDRVLLMLHNDARFAECLLAVLRTGGVAVPANIKLGPDTLAYIARHSDAVALIGHAELADKVEHVRARTPALRTSLLMDAAPSDGVIDY